MGKTGKWLQLKNLREAVEAFPCQLMIVPQIPRFRGPDLKLFHIKPPPRFLRLPPSNSTIHFLTFPSPPPLTVSQARRKSWKIISHCAIIAATRRNPASQQALAYSRASPIATSLLLSSLLFPPFICSWTSSPVRNRPHLTRSTRPPSITTLL